MRQFSTTLPVAAVQFDSVAAIAGEEGVEDVGQRVLHANAIVAITESGVAGGIRADLAVLDRDVGAVAHDDAVRVSGDDGITNNRQVGALEDNSVAVWTRFRAGRIRPDAGASIIREWSRTTRPRPANPLTTNW